MGQTVVWETVKQLSTKLGVGLFEARKYFDHDARLPPAYCYRSTCGDDW